VVTEKATGYPAIGVSVLVKGTTNGTITSMDGDYTLSNVPKNATFFTLIIKFEANEHPNLKKGKFLYTSTLLQALRKL